MNIKPHLLKVYTMFGGSVWYCVTRDPSYSMGIGDTPSEAFESWRFNNFPTLWERIRWLFQ